jgi:hypothetical protein
MNQGIPPELLLQIFEQVESKTDLLSIRLMSITLSSLVTPICFRTIQIIDTPDRVMHMMSLRDSRALASLVEKIVFRQKVEEGFHGAATVQYGTHADIYDRKTAGMLSSLDAYNKLLTILIARCSAVKILVLKSALSHT